MDVRSFTIAHAKQASDRKSRTKAVTVLAVAGAMSLVAGASMTAVGPAGQKPMENTAPVITLGEKISDVRVATFNFDDAGKHATRLQLVKERRHRSGRSSAGAVYGGSAIYGGGGSYGGGGGPTGAGGPDGM
jgi:uncharacterized membrane protein YgcG